MRSCLYPWWYTGYCATAQTISLQMPARGMAVDAHVPGMVTTATTVTNAVTWQFDGKFLE